MAIGTVKFFNQEKGYGFITPDNGGTDVFVHVSAIDGGNLRRDGQKVTYEIGQDRKTGKSRAENVRTVSPQGARHSSQMPQPSTSIVEASLFF